MSIVFCMLLNRGIISKLVEAFTVCLANVPKKSRLLCFLNFTFFLKFL